MRTHWDGCYKQHHECAVAEVERLRAEVAAARELLKKCRGEIEYQDKLLGQMAHFTETDKSLGLDKADHPALAEIDAALKEKP